MKRNKSSEIIFVLALFCIYTLSSLFLSVLGADIYRKNVESSEENYNIRTSVLYLTEKTRQNETIGSVRVDTAVGGDALVLSKDYGDGDIYETWIYAEEGYLCEVLVAPETEIVEGTGQKIMPISKMALTLNTSGLLEIEVEDIRGNLFNSTVYLECDTGVENDE